MASVRAMNRPSNWVNGHRAQNAPTGISSKHFPSLPPPFCCAHALDKSTHTSVLGAQIYIWARVLYVPAYLIAIPYLRTTLWTACIVGIAMVLRATWPGA